MSDHKISIPPNSGSISVNAGDVLTIAASAACTFSCTAGNSFSPSIESVRLAAGNNGPYTAQSAASGTYSATFPTVLKAMTAKSVQINP